MALYLGLDSSTQRLTALLLEVDETLPSAAADGRLPRVVFEHSLVFDDELPSYGTRHGVLPAGDPAVAASPPLMWAEATAPSCCPGSSRRSRLRWQAGCSPPRPRPRRHRPQRPRRRRGPDDGEVDNSACLGAALRAYHADMLAGPGARSAGLRAAPAARRGGPGQGAARHRETDWSAIVRGIAEPTGPTVEPSPAAVRAYRDLAPRYAELERRHRTPAAPAT